MFCTSCGHEINDDSVVCTHCGAPVGGARGPGGSVGPGGPVGPTGPGGLGAKADDNSMLWGLLGCCVPIVGLVLFIMWKDEKPMTAKTAGIGALVGFGISMLSSVVMVILMAMMG